MTSKVIFHRADSLEAPALAPYRTLRRPVDHFRQGILVAEGEKVVRRLMVSDLEIVSMLMTTEWAERLFPSECAGGDRSTEVWVADRVLLEAIVGFHLHQGVMAVARIPRRVSLGSVLDTLQFPFMLVALDGLANSENVGVIVRNCAAFGVSGIIVGPTSSSPYLRRAVRNSMGAVFTMPVFDSEDLAATLRDLRVHRGIDIIAAHPHENQSLSGSTFDHCLCFVLGSEGEGLSPDVLAVCNRRIAIPMLRGTDSLNVSSASAVFLYEAGRQLRRQPEESKVK